MNNILQYRKSARFDKVDLTPGSEAIRPSLFLWWAVFPCCRGHSPGPVIKSGARGRWWGPEKPVLLGVLEVQPTTWPGGYDIRVLPPKTHSHVGTVEWTAASILQLRPHHETLNILCNLGCAGQPWLCCSTLATLCDPGRAMRPRRKVKVVPRGRVS